MRACSRGPQHAWFWRVGVDVATEESAPPKAGVQRNCHSPDPLENRRKRQRFWLIVIPRGKSQTVNARVAQPPPAGEKRAGGTRVFGFRPLKLEGIHKVLLLSPTHPVEVTDSSSQRSGFSPIRTAL
jgi:hypothetical protein